MKPEKILAVKIINYLLAPIIFGLGLITVDLYFSKSHLDYSGLFLAAMLIVLGVYLFSATYFRYYGGIQTIAGICTITIFAGTLIEKIQYEETYTVYDSIFFILFIIFGVSFIFWGKSKHENT